MVRHSAFGLFVVALAGATPGGFGEAVTDEGVPQRFVEATQRQVGAREKPSHGGRPAAGMDAPAPGQGAGKRSLDLSVPAAALEPMGPRDQAGTALYRGLPGLQDVQTATDPLNAMRRALPGMLDPQSDDSAVRLKGRLLMDQAQDRSPKAVDGGQLILEVQTD